MIKVIVGNNEMMNILEKMYTREENIEMSEHLINFGFVFNEFTLVWEKIYTYKIKLIKGDEGYTFSVKKIFELKDHTHKHEIINFRLEDFLINIIQAMKKLKGKKPSEMMNREIIHETWAADVLPIIMFMFYVIHNSKNKTVIEMGTTTKKYKSPELRKYNPPKNKVYNLIDVVRKYERHINKNKHHITCEYGEVKGHFRHLKNGKTIYVKPYSKGKNKDGISKDRIYKLGGV